MSASINIEIDNFFSETLQKKKSTLSTTIFYHPDNASFAEIILALEDHHLSWLKRFFHATNTSQIIIFLYPDQKAMEKGFKRVLPSAHCCFTPIVGETSLIAFTALNNLDNVSPILVHETAHVYFHLITGSREIDTIRQSIPLWLDEGLALYLDSRFRQNFDEVRQQRLALFKKYDKDLLPDLMELYVYFNRLDDNEEFGPRGKLAYAFSYFCMCELVRRFGTQRVIGFLKELYGNSIVGDIFFKHFSFSIEHFNGLMKTSLFGQNSLKDIYESM